MDKHSAFRKRPYIPLLILAAVIAFGFIIMLLWNALMPVIFRLPEITFWQSLGLFVLSRLLLGGFGPGGGGRGRHGRRNRRKEELLHHLRERWEHMTPEQRENLRRTWKRRWDLDLEDEMMGGGDVMTPPVTPPATPPVPPPPPGEGRA